MAWQPVESTDQLRNYNKQKRVAFCQKHAKAHVRRWAFLDAKTVTWHKSRHGYRQFAWQTRDKKDMSIGPGTPWTYMMYAAVGYGHKSKLHFVPPSPPDGSRAHKSKESFDSSHFMTMMEELGEEVKGWREGGRSFSIIMDHASQHTSNKSKAKLVVTDVPLVEDFPPQSWDLNVIENVWGVFNQKLLSLRATTTHGVKETLEKAWAKVEQSTINELVEQVPRRMQEVIQKKGEWIKKKGKKQRV
jgi:hypothetical protein